MRKLIGLVVVLLALYGGYWLVGSRAALRGAETALINARAEGWGDAEAVHLAGFPSRFDLTFTAPMLRRADGAVEWRAGTMQILMLSYRPNEVIAWFPHEQVLRAAGQDYAVTVEDMRASAGVSASPDLPLSHVTLVIKTPQIAAPDGSTLAAAEVRGAIRAAGEPGRYDLGVEVIDLDLPGATLATLANGATIPQRIEWLHLDAALSYDRPLDRHTGETPPRLLATDLRDFELHWGGMALAAQGTVEITATGQPEGRILLRATEWRRMLDMAVDAGLIAPKLAPTMQALGAQMAAASGGEVLELPLVFANGRMSLGPLPLGAAPYLQ
ncbi:DUF2125 domain-containing protein [Phaeovulum sp.]|uniref:DUF2125 domain-containing protein n=1 Tax=Phaeovulum sp. TaxID=2934796 RepID=UPI0039E4A2A9